MNICCCYPDTPQWPKFRWVHEALAELGHEVRWARSRDELIEHEPWAAVTLFAHKSFPIRWPNLRDIWEKRQSVWVQWWFDLISTDTRCDLEAQPYVKAFRPHFDAMDIVFVKERDKLREFQALGIPAVYLDQGCPAYYPEIQRVGPPQWDVLLWGQSGKHYERRFKDASALAESGFKVAWIAAEKTPPGVVPLPWTHPDDLPKLASNAKCVMYCGRRYDIDGYWSDAVWMALGMGAALLLRRPIGWFKDAPCRTYTTTRELVQHATQLCDGEAARELGSEARKWVMERHTIKHRCRALVAKANAEFAAARGICG